MKIQFYCPRWGAEDSPWDAFCQNVKSAGYHGVESPVSEDPADQSEMIDALKKNNLLFIGQYYQSFEKDFERHKENYVEHLHRLAALSPVKINAQTGRDFFSVHQNAELFSIADRISTETGVVICHETHRNKALFAAHITCDFLNRIPDLKLTADFSHWCNVSESLLEDQEEALALACQHTEHIHARVGHTQGAQVMDPRLPEFKKELTVHVAWWDQVVEHHQNKNTEALSITTEFGPVPYMMTLPVTHMPMADQWGINLFMMELLNDRYKA